MNKGRGRLSWLVVGALFALCGFLGWLQYRWIGEVSLASRDRLRASLQATLSRLSNDFNSELTAACAAVAPAGMPADFAEAEAEVVARWQRWSRTVPHSRIFRRIGIAARDENDFALLLLDPGTATFEKAGWPSGWEKLRDRMEIRMPPQRWPERGAPPPPRPDEAITFEFPLLRMRPPAGPPGPFTRREAAWLIFDVSPDYLRDTLLPEVLQRHLGAGHPEYMVEVVTRTSPPAVVYRSDPDRGRSVATHADASVGLLELQYDQLFRRWMPQGVRERRTGPPRTPGRPGPERSVRPDLGRWQLFVQHRAGSLETVVARARWRNLAVTAAVMCLLIASVAALVRFTRRAQRLADLQMEFVAGVSHELRTPLTVIHTAAYNLRGKLAGNPAQVERYGALIQQESGRLKTLVEQVLRFASATAGRVIQEREPVSVETVIEETLDASKPLVQGARCVVERAVEPDLPPILGDPVSLKHALQNLISNAVKYGSEGSRWIGVSASRAGDAIEIRVADRGPGIPPDEQKHVFDPFFRGRRAVQDQVHGTGLGLNLVKKIVEAHGGTIAVNSTPMKGTEFVMRIPAAPSEYIDEFANTAG